MNRNKIYAIVEGHGEASQANRSEKPAVVVLIERLLLDIGCWTVFPAQKMPPFRLSRGKFFRDGDDTLERAVRFHKLYSDCAGLLILLDADDDCPQEKSSHLAKRIHQMERLPFSVTIVLAKREYEAWFLASLETIQQGHSPYESDPEVIRDAKGWLKRQFGYKETRDQAKYTKKIDLQLAQSRSRSFRRLGHAIEEIVQATHDHQVIITPISKGDENRPQSSGG